MKALFFLVTPCLIVIPGLLRAQGGEFDYECQAQYQKQLETAAAAKDKCNYALYMMKLSECIVASSKTSAETKAKLNEQLPKLRKQYADECGGASTGSGEPDNNATLGGARTDTPIFVTDNAGIARAQLGNTLANHSAQTAVNTNQKLDRLSDDLEGMRQNNMEGLTKDEYEFLHQEDVRGDLKDDIFNDVNYQESLPTSAFYKSKLENLNKSSFSATNALAVKPNNTLLGEYDLSGAKSLLEDLVSTPVVTQPLKAYFLSLLPTNIGVPAAFGSHMFTNLSSINNMGNGLIDELMDALSEKTPPEQTWTNIKEITVNNLPYVGSLFRLARRFF